MKGEYVSRFIAFLLTCVATGLVLSVSDDVKDIEAPDSPRAFYYAKNLDVVPLKSIQVVLFCFEILLGVLVVVKAVNRPSEYGEVQELEHAPLANFCISQSFLFLIKGIGLVLLLAFLAFTKKDVMSVRSDYDYLVEQE